jgi:hypothetical protein
MRMRTAASRAVAAVRRRLQTAIGSRFHPTTYDADHTPDAFAARLREQVDLPRGAKS